MGVLKKGILYLCGGLGYVGLELLWRGRSHSSMFFLGGLCFLLIGHLGEVRRPLPVPVRMLLGSGIITAGELGTGLLVNRGFTVWDYRHLPFNFLGQISLVFTLLWVPVSLGAIWIYEKLSERLPG